MSRSEFRAVDAVLIRAAAYPEGLALPAWPDLTGTDVPGWRAWVRQIWDLEGVAEAVAVPSPDLADMITNLCAGKAEFSARQVRGVTESLVRYLLRWTSRATPFG
ncbi:MAG: lantibiotic dehydratase, partial [Streptosporangiaceae bacterium]